MNRNFCIVISVLALFFYPTIGKTANIFEITGPISKTYTEHVDYNPFEYSHFGDVTATLERVGGTEWGIANDPLFPGVDDFSGFTGGNIALIKRGVNSFHNKVYNAQHADASGVIVYNNMIGATNGTLVLSDTNIPAIFASMDVGFELIDFLDQYGTVTVHLHIDTPLHNHPVPEPSMMLLLGSGLVGLIGYGRRHVRK